MSGARRGAAAGPAAGWVALAVLVAGCAAPAPQVAPTADPGGAPGSLAPVFGAPRLVGPGGFPGVGETSLAAGPGGVLLVCSVGSALVHASLDGGATWTASEPLPGQANGDCDVAVAPDGAWHAAWAYGPEVVATSRDQGASWEARTVTPLPTQCGFNPVTGPYTACPAHRPWLRAAGAELSITYYNLRPTVVLFQRSDDGARTWEAPAVVGAHPGFGTAGRMVEVDGELLVPLLFPADLATGTRQLLLARSMDGGAAWSTHPATPPMALRFGFPWLAAAGEQLTLSAALAAGEDASDVVVFTSPDRGATWSEPQVLAAGLGFGEGFPMVSLSAGPRGVVAAWYHFDPGGAGWRLGLAGLGAPGEPPAWTAAPPALGGTDTWLEFFGMVHDEAGVLHLVVPVPEERCEPGGPHCLYHLAAAP